MAKKTTDEETVEQSTGYSPEVERLIAKGKEQGYVTQQEIAGVLPEAEENLEELDELYAALMDQGVEITDQKDALIWDKDDDDNADSGDRSGRRRSQVLVDGPRWIGGRY